LQRVVDIVQRSRNRLGSDATAKAPVPAQQEAR